MTTDGSVSLREHLTALAVAESRRVDDLRVADQKAVEVALENVAKQRTEDQHRDEQYRASQNEWRAESSDRQGTYMTIAAFEEFKRNQAGDNFAGKTGIRGNLALIGTAIALSISLVVAVTSFATR